MLPDQSLVPNLELIISHLELCIETICSLLMFNAKGLNEDLLRIMQYLERILGYQEYSNMELKLLQEIGWQTSVVAVLINERVKAEGITPLKHFNEVIMVKEDQNNTLLLKNNLSFVWSASDSYHRLPKYLLNVLNQWYLANEMHPYLDQHSTAFLIRESRLSETQVRNWYVFFLFLL